MSVSLQPHPQCLEHSSPSKAMAQVIVTRLGVGFGLRPWHPAPKCPRFPCLWLNRALSCVLSGEFHGSTALQRALASYKQDPNRQQRQLSGPTPFSGRGGVFYPRMCLHLTLFLTFPRPRTVPDNNKTSPAPLWSWCRHQPPALITVERAGQECLAPGPLLT